MGFCESCGSPFCRTVWPSPTAVFGKNVRTCLTPWRIADRGGTPYTYETGTAPNRTTMPALRAPVLKARPRKPTVSKQSFMADPTIRDALFVSLHDLMDPLTIYQVLLTSSNVGWTSWDMHGIRGLLALLVHMRALLHHRCAVGDTGSSV